ncbi:hypothetical protein AK812_SmicGene10516 [Symbiodinium microadriaticum]|uniref:Metallo-beta-lactamase domain-containing protein n=1 Tax=Symbiodinium microadriaticum TaxID=2951 RepID=A0A1Q9EFH4_SYMMI|nr:hypothetical protein AK812_SmicGene10516 [Symbiodinium microadriaticum]
MCNCSLVGDTESKDALVVDPGGDVDHIMSRLKFHGLTCKRILITHGHLDHIIGATELKKLTGAVILMNQNDLGIYEKVKEQCRDFRVPPPLEPLLPPDDFLADDSEEETSETSEEEVEMQEVSMPSQAANSKPKVAADVVELDIDINGPESLSTVKSLYLVAQCML